MDLEVRPSVTFMEPFCILDLPNLPDYSSSSGYFRLDRLFFLSLLSSIRIRCPRNPNLLFIITLSYSSSFDLCNLGYTFVLVLHIYLTWYFFPPPPPIVCRLSCKVILQSNIFFSKVFCRNSDKNMFQLSRTYYLTYVTKWNNNNSVWFRNK